MAALTSTLIFKLLDKVSRPAKAVAKSLTGITDAAKRAGRSASSVDRLSDAIKRNNRALDRTRGRLVDAAAGFGILAGAIAAPAKAAMEFETLLEDIGQKIDLAKDKYGELSEEIRSISKQTNQYITDTAKGYDQLAGFGAKKNEISAIMEVNGRAATAYRASLDDLNAAGWAAMDNLKVGPEEYERAMDGAARAGLEGAFEIRDMAAYMPSMTAAYAGLGQTGKKAFLEIAAAAQITRKGAGDASGAATNLENLILKINQKRTITAFADMGVDLERELSKAAKAGLSPLEAIATITKRTLGGDLTKVGHLFQESGAQAGVRSLIQNYEDFEKIRDKAMAEDGLIEKNFGDRMENGAEKMKALKISAQVTQEALGSALAPEIGNVSEKFRPLVDRLGEFIAANPKIVAAVAGSVGALIGFRVLTMGVHYAALLAKGGLLTMLMPFARVSKAARIAAGSNIAYQASLAAMSGGSLGRKGRMMAGIGGMVQAIPGVAKIAGIMKGIAAAVGLISAPLLPVVAGVAALAATGVLIYKYWEPIKAFFSGFFKGLWKGLEPIRNLIMTAFGPVIDVIGPIVMPIFDGISSVVSSIVGWFADLLTPVDAASDTTKSWGEAGEKAGAVFAAAIDLITKPFQFLLGLITVGISKLKEFGSASGVINAVGKFFGGGGPKPNPQPAIAGARARGGPVRGGSTYWVGEEGPELFRAPSNGRIIPNGSAIDAVRGRSNKAWAGSGGITQHITFQFNGVTDKEEMLREFGRQLAAQAEMTLRSLYADIGVD